MDTNLLNRAGFSTQAGQIDAATVAENQQKVEADWLADMLILYPSISPNAWTILKQQATVHPPLPLDEVSLDGIDLESQQVTDQLYALSALQDSDHFPQGYQAIRLEYGDGQVAVLVRGLIRRPQQSGPHLADTHKFLVAVLGASRLDLERYAESVKPVSLEEFRHMQEQWKPQPHESRRVERAARTARFLDRKGLFAIIAIVTAIVVGLAFSVAGITMFAYAFLLTFTGILLGSRGLHYWVLHRVGLPSSDDYCSRGHGRPWKPELSRAPVSCIADYHGERA